MVSKTPHVSFGRSMLHEEQLGLREKIEALAAEGLTRPLHVDTVPGVYAHAEPALFPAARGWVLLFDLHRVFLYDDPAGPESVRADSVVRFIVDDYPFKPLHLLRRHLARHPYKFFYDLAALDLLPLLWRADRPGTVTVLDLLTAEIRTAAANRHPALRVGASPPVQTAASVGSAAAAGAGTFPLTDRVAGAGWRTDSTPRLDDIVSPDVGFIRSERAVLSQASIPDTVTRVAWHEGLAEDFCGGISFRAAEARAVARCEAVERFHVIAPPADEPLVYGSYAELREEAVDPESLFFHHVSIPEQASRYLRYVEYDATTPMHWTWAGDPRRRRGRLVPAQEVWFNVPLLPGESSCIISSTNACALGGCPEEAALFALLEAVERDAYMTMWYLRRTCAQIDPASVRFEPFQLLWARMTATFPNYRIHLFDLTADITIPSVAAIAVRQSGDGPRTLHATAARPQAERALFTALKDLSASLVVGPQAYRRELAEKFLAAPELVFKPEDHRALYALDEPFARLSFLDFDARPRLTAEDLNERAPVKPRETYNLRQVLEQLLAHLHDRDVEVLWKDMTYAEFARRGLHCVRAITPGLYPLWFGHNAARFSVTERLRRMALKYTGRSLSAVGDYNLEIHPLS